MMETCSSFERFWRDQSLVADTRSFWVHFHGESISWARTTYEREISTCEAVGPLSYFSLQGAWEANSPLTLNFWVDFCDCHQRLVCSLKAFGKSLSGESQAKSLAIFFPFHMTFEEAVSFLYFFLCHEHSQQFLLSRSNWQVGDQGKSRAYLKMDRFEGECGCSDFVHLIRGFGSRWYWNQRPSSLHMGNQDVEKAAHVDNEKQKALLTMWLIWLIQMLVSEWRNEEIDKDWLHFACIWCIPLIFDRVCFSKTHVQYPKCLQQEMCLPHRSSTLCHCPRDLWSSKRLGSPGISPNSGSRW